MREVEHIDAASISVEAFRERFILPQRPVMLTNVAPWRGAAPLTMSELRRRFGQVKLSELQGFWSSRVWEGTVPESWTLREYVDHLEAGTLPDAWNTGKPYLMGISLRLTAALRGLSEEILIPEHFAHNLLTHPRFQKIESALLGPMFDFAGMDLFVWPPSTPHQPGVHFDSLRVSVVSTVTEGAKRFLLFPPEATELLYPHEAGRCGDTGQYRFSRVTCRGLENGDSERHPLFDIALRDHGVLADVRPGSVLYMPSRWWHWVQGTAPGVSLSWRFLDPQLAGDFFADVAGAGAFRLSQTLQRAWSHLKSQTSLPS
jgi:hypothetical protein